MPKCNGFTLEQLRIFLKMDIRTLHKVLKQIGFVRRVKYIAGEGKKVYYPLTNEEAKTIIKGVFAARERLAMRRAGEIF